MATNTEARMAGNGETTPGPVAQAVRTPTTPEMQLVELQIPVGCHHCGSRDVLILLQNRRRGRKTKWVSQNTVAWCKDCEQEIRIQQRVKV